MLFRMPVELIIAIRYIFTKRNFQFITIISFISIIGITVGVAALIIVMSIFNGFQELTERQLMGYDPHIRISPKDGNRLMNSDSIMQIINKNQNVILSSKLLSGKVVGINNNIVQVFNLQGIDKKSADFYSEVKSNIVAGKFKLTLEDETPGIIIGAGLAEKLKVMPGDSVKIVSPRIIESSISSFKPYQSINVVVTALFQTNIQDFDIRDGFVMMPTARKIFHTPGEIVSSIELKIKGTYKSYQIGDELKKSLKNEYKIETWQDLNNDLYKIMKFERIAAFLILSLIIILAVFNVLVSLTMTVVEKRSDISALKAMGANSKVIRNIFLAEGSFIGIISTLAGILLGLGFCYGQINFKWFAIDTNKYIIDAIPVSVNFNDVLIVAAVSLVLSTIATIYPSMRASNQDIIKGIRSE